MAKREFWESCIALKPGSLSAEFLASQLMRGIRQGRFLPLEKIPNLRDLRLFFEARGRPYSTAFLNQAMQRVEKQGMINYLGGRGYRYQGRGFYVSAPPEFSFSQVCRKVELWPVHEAILEPTIRHDILSGKMRPGAPLPENKYLRSILGAGLPNGEWSLVQRLLQSGLIVRTKNTRRMKRYAIAPTEQHYALALSQIHDRIRQWIANGFSTEWIAEFLQHIFLKKDALDFPVSRKPQDRMFDLAELHLSDLGNFKPMTFQKWYHHFASLISQGVLAPLHQMPSSSKIAAGVPGATRAPLHIAFEHLFFDGFLCRSGRTFETVYWVAPRQRWFTLAVHRMKKWLNILENQGYPRAIIAAAAKGFIAQQSSSHGEQ